MFRLRIDIVNDLNSDDVIEVVKPDTYVIVRHELPHGNPHYHMFIDSDIKENTLRQRIKRKFSYLKSTDYSIKKCDAERVNEYVQYMFNTKHGNKWELIDTLNFDLKLLDDLQKAAKEISESYKQRDPKKSDKPTVWELTEELNYELTKRFTRINHLNISEEEEVPFPQLYENALEIAIKLCNKYKQPFEEHYLRRLVTTALGKRSNGRKGLIRKIMEKEFYGK